MLDYILYMYIIYYRYDVFVTIMYIYSDFYNFCILKDINEEPKYEEATCAVFKTRIKTDIF